MSAPDLARRPALLGRRIGAYLIDGAVALVVLLVAAAVLGGGGGGRDDVAQGGGTDAAALPAALDAVTRALGTTTA